MKDIRLFFPKIRTENHSKHTNTIANEKGLNMRSVTAETEVILSQNSNRIKSEINEKNFL